MHSSKGVGESAREIGLDQPLLRGLLDDVVQLQPGRGQLLGGGLVLALGLPLPPGHDEEDEQADDGDEEHPAHDGADDQGDVAGAPGSLIHFNFLKSGAIFKSSGKPEN